MRVYFLSGCVKVIYGFDPQAILETVFHYLLVSFLMTILPFYMGYFKDNYKVYMVVAKYLKVERPIMILDDNKWAHITK